jgi:hypothetical protein
MVRAVRVGLVSVVVTITVLMSTGPVRATHTTEVTVRQATLVNPGQIQVTGVIVCTTNFNAGIGVSVSQRGRGDGGTNHGSGGTSFVCGSNGLESWTVDVFGASFHPGPAIVTANGAVCDATFTDCAKDTDILEIRLR